MEPTTKPGRERVKAWIYTVINPILDGLAIEAVFLEKGNWTFRRYNRELEFIRPVTGLVNHQGRRNVVDFALSNPSAKERIDGRDEQRAQLRDACRVAFDNLAANLGFRREVEECLQVFEVESPAESNRIGHPGVKPHEIMAELVVNNRECVPDHAGIYPFWSRYRDQFMPFRVGAEFESADQAGLKLKERSENLSLVLAETRSDLAAEYDVPWDPYPNGAVVLSGR